MTRSNNDLVIVVYNNVFCRLPVNQIDTYESFRGITQGSPWDHLVESHRDHLGITHLNIISAVPNYQRQGNSVSWIIISIRDVTVAINHNLNCKKYIILKHLKHGTLLLARWLLAQDKVKIVGKKQIQLNAQRRENVLKNAVPNCHIPTISLVYSYVVCNKCFCNPLQRRHTFLLQFSRFKVFRKMALERIRNWPWNGSVFIDLQVHLQFT